MYETETFDGHVAIALVLKNRLFIDSDSDGLNDCEEQELGTDPNPQILMEMDFLMRMRWIVSAILPMPMSSVMHVAGSTMIRGIWFLPETIMETLL